MYNFRKKQKIRVSANDTEYTALFHSFSREQGKAYVTNMKGEKIKVIRLNQIKNKE